LGVIFPNSPVSGAEIPMEPNVQIQFSNSEGV
jgi:hypothetical protein